MANEDKKDFNAMLQDNKDMPKFQIITDVKSIEKYGGNKMYFAPPIAYDEVMKKIPYGKVITVGKIREFFAKENDADFTEPITAGIFVSIAATCGAPQIRRHRGGLGINTPPLFPVYADYTALNRKRQYSFQTPLLFPSSYRYGLIFGVECYI